VERVRGGAAPGGAGCVVQAKGGVGFGTVLQEDLLHLLKSLGRIVNMALNEGVQYENNELGSLEQIRNIPSSLTIENGPITVPLSNVADVKRVTIPGEMAHYNIARVNDVYVNVAGLSGVLVVL